MAVAIAVVWNLPDGENQTGNAAIVLPVGEPAAKPKPKVDRFKKTFAPFLKTYCFDCHGPDEQEGEIAFDKYTSEKELLADRKTFEKAFKMLSKGAMPPTDYDPIPEKKEVKEIVDYLDDVLFKAECGTSPDPGRVTVRRLNKAEYNNTIRDLLGLEGDWSKDFPSDDVGEGFDNNGDVLSLPPLLMEKYLTAAERIAERAIVNAPPSERRVVDEDRGGELFPERGRRMAGGTIVLSTVGAVRAQFPVPKADEYLVRIEAMADQAGSEPAKMELIVEGKTVKTFEVTGRRQWKNYEHRIRLPEGNRAVKVRFPNDFYNPRERDRSRRDRNLYVRAMTLMKLKDAPEDLTDAHRRLMTARPGKGKSLAQAATEIFKNFCRRAWRRPVEDAEVKPYVRLVKLAVDQGDNFERGVQLGVTGVLVSPQFLFRIEQDPNPNDATVSHKISHFELASRLSYFLWSSMPDEWLMQLAAQGKLHDEKVLASEVQRMLKDPKARALTRNFAAQWLNLRLLDEFNPPRRRYPDYYARRMELKRSMKRETEMLFEYILKNDRPISEFLTAEYTFVNQPLAKHYGLSGVSGRKFEMVSLKGTGRRGILTHASILALTSNPTHTSPVKRGKWILENVLNDAPPDPPDDVPDLAETKKANPKASLREQLKLHRENGTCASCHKMMDPIGLGFENFDIVGRWRERDGQHKIDPSGALPGDKQFTNHSQLITIIAGERKKFAQAITEKLMIYGLGRGLEFYDHCAVEAIVDGREAGNYRLQSLITAVVQSRPFRYRRGETKPK